MTYGVFIHRSDSIYDDSPAERYHFPRDYLGRVQACVGDWIVYYEPVKATKSRGYFALARVRSVGPDPTRPDMFYAWIEPGTYLEFARPVPFRSGGDLVERGLLNDRGAISGRAQAAVRLLSPVDLDRILSLGLDTPDVLLPREPVIDQAGFSGGEQAPYDVGLQGRLTVLTSRKERDQIFRRVVLRAYEERCAITGLRLINGGGRAEVEAAHIRPVQHDGPDAIGNGIALSGTAHWMFDRGLIGLDDDLAILVSRHANDVDGIRSLINASGRLIGPLDPRDRPHPRYLQWHRECCFKQ